MAIEDISAEEIENELLTWLVIKNDKPLASEGWYTAGWMSKRGRMAYDRAIDLLNRGVESGELEVRVYGASNYYRMKKG